MAASLRTTLVALVPLLALLQLVPSSTPVQGAPTQGASAPQIVSELARLRGAAAAAIPSDQRASVAARLDRAAAALDARRGYLALYLLESGFEMTSASGFASAAGISTADGFVRKWRDLGVPAASPAAGERPAIVEALAAAAEGRAPATYQASRPYAEDSGVEAGLYYLGESRAQIAFAAFARGTTWPDAGRRPPFRSIAAEIAALDADMTRQYETMAAADHPTYIVASAALKQARSLEEGRHFEGALFEYLLARYLFAPLRGPAREEATAGRVAAARAALAPGRDHSIAEFFLQLADEGVSGTVPAQRRGAAAAIDEVLPAYFAAVAPPSVIATAHAAAQVTITLVRWPFT